MEHAAGVRAMTLSEQAQSAGGVEQPPVDSVGSDDLPPTHWQAWGRSALPWITLIGSRIIRLVVVLLLVSLATMAMLQLLPGGPEAAILGPTATKDQIHVIDHQLGLDKPFVTRYGDWISDILHGNFGRSTFTQQSVSTILLTRLPVTAELAIGALLVALLIGIPAAVYAAARPGGWFDRAINVLGSGLIAMPTFILAVLLIYVLAVRWRIFPALGWVGLSQSIWGNIKHAFLPVMSLALTLAAIFARLLRNDMVATLQEDFILAARARGLPRRRVLFIHALKPSSFSLLTVAGVTLGQLIGGTVIAESLFTLPGLGSEAVKAIGSRDFVTVRGIVVVVSIAYVVLNTLVDLMYRFLDPRVRATGPR
jgi:peptide/nickel transport system permease protein